MLQLLLSGKQQERAQRGRHAHACSVRTAAAHTTSGTSTDFVPRCYYSQCDSGGATRSARWLIRLLAASIHSLACLHASACKVWCDSVVCVKS